MATRPSTPSTGTERTQPGNAPDFVGDRPVPAPQPGGPVGEPPSDAEGEEEPTVEELEDVEEEAEEDAGATTPTTEEAVRGP